ncbi:hypothetical protein EMPS_00209 [Entomortierella parvispora]|uniref:RBR-type E3 ubiquitin transferase n=1 Tax=Entomortierella parvispora TaxID=205924 RepID=A0A9P3GZP3_9FUNG|nr:hypothetical protein EMPS_00209 [Entomortierella parvispora]
MALQELDERDDDYVFLSDIESEQEPHSFGAALGSHNTGKHPLSRSRPISSHSAAGPSSDQRRSQNEQDPSREGSQSSSKRSSRIEPPRAEDADELDSDPEEIEYGYDTDMLLIMPSMLRDYSHHATNYHPELWKAPIPGSYSPPRSSARLRQEDRMLDRAELLKNTIPPTTCGICFESFTPFDLQPQQQQPPQQDEHNFANHITSELASQAQFVTSFAARLARSFAPHHIPGTGSASTTPLTSPTEPVQSDASSSTANTDVGSSSSGPSSSSAPRETRQQQSAQQKQQRFSMATTSPSVSSRDIGIIMPCDHGLCLSCLQSYLTNATTSASARAPTLCPQPGCRTPIPTESAELVLDSNLLEAWYRKLAEIHVANKVCCPRPECQSIVDLDDRDGTAVTCPECKSSFCASCAVPFHRGLSCEEYQNQAHGGGSEEDRAMLQLVQDRHWRHCPSCRFVIEKQQGCNHMVCHCGQSFCYACGHPWNEMDARCSRDCESEGIHDDIGLDCIIM